MLNATLGVGPMSKEIIESVFRVSDLRGEQIMLISSLNQIDHDFGYVFTTKQYETFINKMRSIYPNSNVKLCRDHCGPGFCKEKTNIEDIKETVKCDIACGFDLIHVDMSKAQGSHSEVIESTKEVIEFAKNINNDILFEIGTEDSTTKKMDLDQVIGDVASVADFCSPEFFVVCTGSHVKGISNVGSFNRSQVETISKYLRSQGIKIKEHNADYLGREDIRERRGLVDAMNVAPQMGVVQTSVIMTQSMLYGVDITPFSQIVYNGKNWEKWIPDERRPDFALTTLLAGHYHYASFEYDSVINELSAHTPIKELIITHIMELIEHYINEQKNH